MVLVEPQCHKEEHTMVNSLFIKGLLKSSSDFELKLFAEKNHLKLVSENLNSEKKMIFKSIKIPKRGTSNARRLINEFKLISKIFFYTKKEKLDKIIFLSSTSAGIFCIKILSIFFNKIEIFIVLHSIIESIDKKKKIPIWDYPFNLLFILSILKNNKTKFILFNKFSLMRFEKKYSKLSPYFKTIEFPFEFDANDKKNHTLINEENKIIFASIGDFNKRKNSNLFFDLANQHSNLNSIYEYKM
jgi:hypothetical protein